MALDFKLNPNAALSNASLIRQGSERTGWVTASNNYQRIRFFETGTNNPQLITKVNFYLTN